MSNTDLPADFRERFLALHTALFCDSLDRMGIQPQVMDYRIRPVYPGAVIVGRALPVLWVSVYRPPKNPTSISSKPFAPCSRTTCLS